jgi:hypothetical protein
MIRHRDYSIIEGEQYGELFIPEKHEYGVSAYPTDQKHTLPIIHTATIIVQAVLWSKE